MLLRTFPHLVFFLARVSPLPHDASFAIRSFFGLLPQGLVHSSSFSDSAGDTRGEGRSGILPFSGLPSLSLGASGRLFT